MSVSRRKSSKRELAGFGLHIVSYCHRLTCAFWVESRGIHVPEGMAFAQTVIGKP